MDEQINDNKKVFGEKSKKEIYWYFGGGLIGLVPTIIFIIKICLSYNLWFLVMAIFFGIGTISGLLIGTILKFAFPSDLIILTDTAIELPKKRIVIPLDDISHIFGRGATNGDSGYNFSWGYVKFTLNNGKKYKQRHIANAVKTGIILTKAVQLTRALQSKATTLENG